MTSKNHQRLLLEAFCYRIWIPFEIISRNGNPTTAFHLKRMSWLFFPVYQNDQILLLAIFFHSSLEHKVPAITELLNSNNISYQTAQLLQYEEKKILGKMQAKVANFFRYSSGYKLNTISSTIFIIGRCSKNISGSQADRRYL